ncbi:probable tRNA N6-adenosine threonylcarbamoyltransferase, mitochondrial isoform X2 [Eurytemora carolleeae]|uniref:probable tRNA N6-adenosine threonylcarbamoyltransferase, mitochondrial isoform X2 n=1 Tax=Eurytemora carolleeae TaxID=1294199 RepID=UPI000C7729C2|nr:probable tRNA N6-adenosine threonylcarbamoyltransferase, mitochondrial isoform X2 [Eurytemora carolleeae]|eukprot:XP_023333368.1 probable tRNA N6-adenosine threonylcarbamoyltransferase, mitochondrial isoform X2 [Eurytemora affinis]
MFRSCCYSRLLRHKETLIRTRRNLILGIETSCDDTGAAVIDLSGRLLGESLSTQLSTRFGGVIPTFAMVFHTDKIQGVVEEALKQADVTMEDVSVIAVTNRPGLKGPLIIGTDYAKYLCTKYNKPLIPIHHMAAHALTVRMEQDVKFPFLFLLISGGHCILGIAKDIDNFTLLGEGLDGSPGEMLDKAARNLKLHSLPNMRDISGGLAVETLAKKAVNPIKFTVPLHNERNCNFSFSGYKGHLHLVLRRLEKNRELPFDSQSVIPEASDVCAGLQYAVSKHLCERLQRGIEFTEYKELMSVGSTLVVSGGVASNQFIRGSISRVCESLGWKAVFPNPKLCTDNGIMIAWAGYEFWRSERGIIQPQDVFQVPVIPKCPIGNYENNPFMVYILGAQ